MRVVDESSTIRTEQCLEYADSVGFAHYSGFPNSYYQHSVHSIVLSVLDFEACSFSLRVFNHVGFRVADGKPLLGDLVWSMELFNLPIVRFQRIINAALDGDLIVNQP